MKTFIEYMNLSNKQMKYYYYYLLPSESINHFEKRTGEHIDRVKYCAVLLSQEYNGDNFNKELFLSNVQNHDASKFYSDIYPGYVWINTHYNLNTPYPNNEVKELANTACKLHYENENHHPEHWANYNTMNDYSIMEMVCDWCSMSMEYNSSLTNWVKQKAFNKYNFNSENKNKILNLIDIFNNYSIIDLEKEFKKEL